MKMKSIRWLIILIPCLILCPGTRSPAMAGEIDAIRAKGEIVVSLIQEFPPFAMMVDGQLTRPGCGPGEAFGGVSRCEGPVYPAGDVRPADPEAPFGRVGHHYRRHDADRRKGASRQLHRPLFRGEPGGHGPAGNGLRPCPIPFLISSR